MPLRKLFLLLLLLPWCGFSQTREKVALKIVLDEIAQTHQVRFSYIDEELVVYMIVPPDAKKPLKTKLDYIQKQTRLRIVSVSSNYYTIYNDRKMDKPLCGFLIDAETGRGIENAQVIINDTPHSATSNADGYFELPVLSPNTISMRHLGYKPITLEAQNLYVNDCPKIEMTAVVEKLDEVTARRYLATGIAKNNSGELVIRPGKFGILPGLTEPDVLQTLQQVPGIVSVDETVSNISVRGGTHDQNLFLWNGVRMFQTAHFFGLISAFNPLLATHVSVSKNGSSAFFGESVSSLIDISSHTRVTDSCYNVVTVDMISANFFSKIRLSDKATIQASGRRTYTDVFVSPTFKQYEERVFDNTVVTDSSQNETVTLNGDDSFEFYDISMQYHQKIGQKHDFIADAIGIENRVALKRQTDTEEQDNNLRQRNFGASLTWKTHWNDTHNSDLQAYGSWYDLESSRTVVDAGLSAEQRNNVLDLGLRFRHVYTPSPRLEMSAGYQMDRIAITDEDKPQEAAVAITDEHISVSHALIAESRYRSQDGLTELRGGLRANYFGKYGLFMLEPRLVIGRMLSEQIKLEVLAERKSQTVSQLVYQQEDFLGLENRRWTLANEDGIPIQKSAQASLGLTYNNSGWLIALDNFYKKISGITSEGQGFTNQFEFESATGDYRVLGAELLVQKSFGRFLSWVSYSFNDNQYDFDGFSPSEFANNYTISHAVSWAGIYEWHKLRMALGMKWHTGRPITTPEAFVADEEDPANSEIIYGNPNNERLDEFLQFNFSASRSWDVSRMVRITANGSMLNIFDRDNPINRYYRVNTAANSMETVSAYGLGRTVNLGVRIDF